MKGGTYLETNCPSSNGHLLVFGGSKPLSGSGPEGYPRVLDYSIFKSLLVPYSENFTTRPSSRVVAIFTFFVRIIQISKKWKSNTSMMTSCNNLNNVHLPLSWNSCTKRGIKIQNTPKLGIWGGLASQFSWPLEAC